MPIASEAWVTRQFRSLSAAERRAFLAAVWDARGYETDVEDGVVVARGSDTVEIGVVGRLSFHIPNVDVLVGTHDTGRARERAADQGAEFVSPSGLYELLLYGIDRPESNEISREHFGTPLTAAPAQDVPLRSSPVAVVSVITVVVLAALFGSLGGSPRQPGNGPLDTTGATSPIQGQALSAASSSLNGSETALDQSSLVETTKNYPRGLNPNGSVDAFQLARTHRRQVTGHSRYVTMTYSGPESTILRPTVTREHTSLWRNQSHFRYVRSVTGTNPSGTTREWTTEGYLGDRGLWIRHRETTFRASHLRKAIWPDIQDLFIRPYIFAMGANETTVQRVQVLGKPLYRVTATDRPNTEAFSAVAYLTTDGRLVYLSISYTDPETGNPVSVEVAYRRVGAIGRIEPPPWYGNNTTTLATAE